MLAMAEIRSFLKSVLNDSSRIMSAPGLYTFDQRKD